MKNLDAELADDKYSPKMGKKSRKTLVKPGKKAAKTSASAAFMPKKSTDDMGKGYMGC